MTIAPERPTQPEPFPRIDPDPGDPQPDRPFPPKDPVPGPDPLPDRPPMPEPPVEPIPQITA